jgi:fumarylacetoacetase
LFAQPTLNPLMAAGPPTWRLARSWVVEQSAGIADGGRTDHTYPLDQVRLMLPFEVADYVDFYASEHHASNVGRIFRPDSPSLPASWKHLPIGYHGRAGTVVVSGTDVVRPCGQTRPGPDGVPGFGPSRRLDIECEVGFVVGTPTDLGTPVPVAEAADHIFGVVLVNDWSARDIQAWEYVPLGPFLGKSFATSVSAWVLPYAALEPARVPLPTQDPPVSAYLDGDGTASYGLDLRLSVEVNGHEVSRPAYRDMYWSPAQMLAHMTVNGAALRTGDLFASGTVSGPQRDTVGSLIELTWNGTEPVRLPDGRDLTFLEDGDTVTITGWAPGPDGSRLTLGAVTATVTPAR